MNKEVTENKKAKKTSATINLQRLADIFFEKQAFVAIDEIRDARNVIAQLVRDVKTKLDGNIGREDTKPVVNSSPRKPAVLPSKGLDLRDPNKLYSNSFGKTNREKPREERPRSASFGGKRP